MLTDRRTDKQIGITKLTNLIKIVAEQAMCHNDVSVWKRKKERKFTYHFCSRVTGIETKMMLIVLLGLIAKLTSVSGDCGVVNEGVTNLNWDKVGIGVLIQLLKQAAFKLLNGFYI
jgi:hypothetical protein